MRIHRPYLLFLGDAPDALAAKTARGVADWRPEWCLGQVRLEGCRAIIQAGGRALVQDQASSVVWGMPGAVAQAGLAEEVLPLSRMARAIHGRALSSASRRPRAAISGSTSRGGS